MRKKIAVILSFALVLGTVAAPKVEAKKKPKLNKKKVTIKVGKTVKLKLKNAKAKKVKWKSTKKKVAKVNKKGKVKGLKAGKATIIAKYKKKSYKCKVKVKKAGNKEEDAQSSDASVNSTSASASASPVGSASAGVTPGNASASSTPKSSTAPKVSPATSTDNNGGQTATGNPGQTATDNPGQAATDNPGQAATDNPGQAATDNPGQTVTEDPQGGNETSIPDVYPGVTVTPDSGVDATPVATEEVPWDVTPEVTPETTPEATPEVNEPTTTPKVNEKKVMVQGEVSADDFQGDTTITELVVLPGAVIADEAFKDCTNLTTITFQDGTDEETIVGKRAFEGCTGLKDVYVGNVVTTIGNSAFALCKSLQEFRASEENETYYTIDGVLYGKLGSLRRDTLCYYPPAKEDTSFTIPSATYDVGDYAFQDAKNLKEILIDKFTTYYGNYAFYNCSSLKTITLPFSTSYIGTGAFDGCTSLESIKMGVDALDDQNEGQYLASDGVLFYEDSQQGTEIRVYPQGKKDSQYTITVPRVNPYVFAGNKYLTSISMNDQVTKLDSYAFAGATELKNVTFGSNVTTICEGAFKECTSLESITIPASVKQIDGFVFEGCEKLSSITVESGNAYIQAEDNVLYQKENGNITKILYYPMTKKDASFAVASTITTIHGGAFYGNKYLKNLDMSQATALKTISSEAFYKCSALESLELDNTNVTNIRRYAFADCTSLSSVKMTDTTRNIEAYAFYNCTSLSSIKLYRSKLSSIGENALGMYDNNGEDAVVSGFIIYITGKGSGIPACVQNYCEATGITATE